MIHTSPCTNGKIKHQGTADYYYLQRHTQMTVKNLAKTPQRKIEKADK